MAITQREETIWNMIWLLVGVPIMITGIVVGARFDDYGLMIGAPLAITLILFTTRDTLLPFLERTAMFRRQKKSKPIVTLSVVSRDDPNHVGVLEVDRNPGGFHQNDRLDILSIGVARGENVEIARVYINGNSGAGTVIVRNGNFHKGQRLRVESIEVS